MTTKATQSEISFKYDKAYIRFLNDLKGKIRSTQIKAALQVNHHLIQIYWHVGASITQEIISQKWGMKIIDTLARDLSSEFVELKGFSRSNLYSICQWYNFYKHGGEKVQQLVGQIPWGHNVMITI